jgi:hypothetical protein
MKTILIVDGIINKKYLKNKNVDIFLLNSGKKKIERFSNEIFGCTHSTIIAQILERNVKETFKIINIALECDEEKRIDIEDLSIALEKGLDYDINVINLSIGSRRLSDIKYLKKVIKKINNRNIPIISSISNSMNMTIPASLEGCIGVANDFDNIYPPQKIMNVEENILGINYLVNSAKLFENEFYKPSNSYSTAYVSAAYLNSELFKDENKIIFKRNREKGSCTFKINFVNFEEYLEIVSIFIEKYNIEAVGVLLDKKRALLFSINEIKYYRMEEIDDVIKTIVCDIVLIFSSENIENIMDLIVTKNRDNIILEDYKGSIEYIQYDLQKIVEKIIKII